MSTVEVFRRNGAGTDRQEYVIEGTTEAFVAGYGYAAEPDVIQVRVRTGNVFTDLKGGSMSVTGELKQCETCDRQFPVRRKQFPWDSDYDRICTACEDAAIDRAVWAAEKTRNGGVD